MVPWSLSWIYNQDNFSYIWSTLHLNNPTGFESIGLSVKEKIEIDFQDGHLSSHLGFPISTILAIFIYNISQYFLPSFKSNGLSVQEVKFKTDFQDGHVGFSIRTILAILTYVTPILPSKFHVSWPNSVQEKLKIDFQDDHHGSHLGFPNEPF